MLGLMTSAQMADVLPNHPHLSGHCAGKRAVWKPVYARPVRAARPGLLLGTLEVLQKSSGDSSLPAGVQVTTANHKACPLVPLPLRIEEIEAEED